MGIFHTVPEEEAMQLLKAKASESAWAKLELPQIENAHFIEDKTYNTLYWGQYNGEKNGLGIQVNGDKSIYVGEFKNNH